MQDEEAQATVMQKPKSRLWAAVLSFFFPGLGHFYAGVALPLALAISVFYYTSQELTPWMFRFIESWSTQTIVATGFSWLLNVLILASAVRYLSIQSSQGPARPWYGYLGYVTSLVVLTVGIGYATNNDTVRSFHTWDQSSQSMEPTILVGDRVWCDMAAYRLADEPTYGELVIVKAPDDGEGSYIKRIVGLSGDRIEIIDGLLLVNGSRLTNADRDEESFMGRSYQIKLESKQSGKHPMLNYPNGEEAHIVAPGSVFVMGDNRLLSIDSRIWGDVPLVKLRGRCEGVVWSYEGDEGVRWDRVMMDLR